MIKLSILSIGKPVVMLVISLGLTGCTMRRVDFIWPMQISGSVVNAHGGEPVDGASVIFYDEYTYPLYGREIGSSTEGNVDENYIYTVGKKEYKPIWSRYKGLDGKFVIELAHEHYQTETREFDFGSFGDCSPHLVSLGEIRLEPLNASIEK